MKSVQKYLKIKMKKFDYHIAEYKVNNISKYYPFICTSIEQNNYKGRILLPFILTKYSNGQFESVVPKINKWIPLESLNPQKKDITDINSGYGKYYDYP